MNEGQRVGCFALAFDEQVHVIRHEAVRDFFHVKQRGGLQNLIVHTRHGLVLDGVRVPLCRAECEEISLQSDVQRRIETRPVLAHRTAAMQRVIQDQGSPKGLRYEDNRRPTPLPTTDSTPDYRRDSRRRLPTIDYAPSPIHR
jgi:hypothetical protein